ncbi:hypothetical protein SAMN04488168_103139 [Bacillus sp. 491mf]|uniref:hypothetical protein n=1 Tax=Bacillus TaxID=1386 RepID=UPI000552122E|nr:MULTISPECIES: hypothetical protein [unclassified Bacillus (in: firmicutes)]SFC29110.1 hypothetical protein SAMN04488168_103139 [Bacillus sp. 491mf]
MNKNYVWLALLLSFLVVKPFRWFFLTHSLFLDIIYTLTEFALYFLVILLILRLLQYVKDKSSNEKQIIELLKEIKNDIERKKKETES